MAGATEVEVGRERPQGRTETIREFVSLLGALRAEGWGELSGYLFILPAVILYLIFNVWPLIRGLLMCFQDYRWLIPETQGLFTSYSGLDNFREALHDKWFWWGWRITGAFALMYIPANICLSLFVAVLISKVKSVKLASFFRVTVYLPVVIPITAGMLMWRQLLHSDYGYINYFLESILRLPFQGPLWLTTPKWALRSLTMAWLWKRFGYNTLLLLVGIYNINQELYEAAAIDGANAWQQFWHITLPLLKPVMTIVLVLISGALHQTQAPMAMAESWAGGQGPANATLTLGLYSWRVAFHYGDMRMGYAAAINLMIGVAAMIISAFVFRLLRTERA